MPVCEIDLSVGGVYREITPPKRLVYTERFDGDGMGGEALVTTILTEERGKATVTTTMLFESREARDGALRSGMEKGVAASYDRRAGLLASMQVEGPQGGA